MLAQIKNNHVNSEKLLAISYAESSKNLKNYAVLEMDILKDQNKIFIEVRDYDEFKEILQSLSDQLK